MTFSCQEWSRLRSKQPNQISDYFVIHFVHAWRNHSVKNGVFTKDTHFYAPGITIHNQVKYIIIDYCDQEAKKFRHSIILPKVTSKLLVPRRCVFILCYRSLRMNGNEDSRSIERRLAFQCQCRNMANDMCRHETCLALPPICWLVNLKGFRLKGFSIGNV